MKKQALNLMTNVDKGQLLFSMFPEQIPTIIEHVKNFCQMIIESEGKIEDGWTNGLITPSFWINNAKIVKGICEAQAANIRKKSPSYIADQMFSDLRALTTVDAICKMKKTEDAKLRTAIHLLFK